MEVAGQRVEVKSAQLVFDKNNQCWQAKFANVKPDEYDDLYLALYTPSGVYIYKHDGEYGMSTNGQAQESSGGKVQVRGPSHTPDIEQATAAIHAKLATMFLAHLAY